MARVFELMPHVHVHQQVVFHVGEWVAIHDIVPNWRVGGGPEHEMQWVALYRVVNGKIQRPAVQLDSTASVAIAHDAFLARRCRRSIAALRAVSGKDPLG